MGKVKDFIHNELYLRIAHAVSATVCLTVGIGLLAATNSDDSYPWYTFFCDPDPAYPVYNSTASNRTDWDGRPPCYPIAKKVADIPLGYFCGAFLVMAAVDHLASCVPGPWFNLYKDMEYRRVNYFRWFEYFFSASLMHVVMAQLSSVTDVHLLFAVFGLTAVCMMFGGLCDWHNSPFRDSEPEKCSPVPLLLGFVPYLFQWAIIWCYFFQFVSNGDPPSFVWAIIFILTFLDLTFAVNSFLQWIWRPAYWKDYIFGEWVFIVLSLTSKLFLALITFFGATAAADIPSPP